MTSTGSVRAISTDRRTTATRGADKPRRIDAGLVLSGRTCLYTDGANTEVFLHALNIKKKNELNVKIQNEKNLFVTPD